MNVYKKITEEAQVFEQSTYDKAFDILKKYDVSYFSRGGTPGNYKSYHFKIGDVESSFQVTRDEWGEDVKYSPWYEFGFKEYSMDPDTFLSQLEYDIKNLQNKVADSPDNSKNTLKDIPSGEGRLQYGDDIAQVVDGYTGETVYEGYYEDAPYTSANLKWNESKQYYELDLFNTKLIYRKMK